MNLGQHLVLAEDLMTRDAMLEPSDLPGRYGRVIQLIKVNSEQLGRVRASLESVHFTYVTQFDDLVQQANAEM